MSPSRVATEELKDKADACIGNEIDEMNPTSRIFQIQIHKDRRQDEKAQTFHPLDREQIHTIGGNKAVCVPVKYPA